jgi:hypothetical protein
LAAAEASLKESEAARSLSESQLSQAEARLLLIPKLEQTVGDLRAKLGKAEEQSRERGGECDRWVVC